jgi:hypothetical protein
LHGITSDGTVWATGTAIPGKEKAIGEWEVGTPSCKWDGKLIRRTLKRDKTMGNRIIGCSIKHGWASLWDGKPCGWTAYA